MDSDVEAFDGFVDEGGCHTEVGVRDGLAGCEESLDSGGTGNFCNILDHGVDFEQQKYRYVVARLVVVDPIFCSGLTKCAHIAMAEFDDERAVACIFATVLDKPAKIRDGGGDIVEGCTAGA